MVRRQRTPDGLRLSNGEHIVAIIGAGASLAEATYHRRTWVKSHPPLDTTFFEQALRLDASPRQDLVTYAESTGMPNPFEPPYPRMEQVFGEVFFDLSRSDPLVDPTPLRAYSTLVRLYGSVIAQTTNWLYDRPSGLMGKYLRALVAGSPARITLITFNQDLVIENAVVQLPWRQRWCLDEGYGNIDLATVRTTARVPQLPRHDKDCDHQIEIKVLKLHGSLNWQVETRSHQPTYNDLFPQPGTVKTIQCVSDRVIQTSLQRKRGKRNWRLWPVIVPPIYEKNSIIAARFSNLWQQAEDSIASASRLTLIGYSLPLADIHSANLLRRGFRRNAVLSSLNIVNPDPTIPGRVAEVMNAESVTWFRDISSYTEYVQRIP